MTRLLEITQLENGEIVLKETDDESEPLIRLRFSEEVREMLGQDLVGVAEAMIDAATDYLSSEAATEESADAEEPAPTIH
jgi:hypothetical protein